MRGITLVRYYISQARLSKSGSEWKLNRKKSKLSLQ